MSTICFVFSSITEENFWRNYFYRLSLICQANEADAAAASRQPSADDSQGTYHHESPKYFIVKLGDTSNNLNMHIDALRHLLRVLCF